jgi:hypothetical protein
LPRTLPKTSINPGSITTDEILDATISAADLAAASVEASEIATGAVATAEILDATILPADISDKLGTLKQISMVKGTTSSPTYTLASAVVIAEMTTTLTIDDNSLIVMLFASSMHGTSTGVHKLNIYLKENGTALGSTFHYGIPTATRTLAVSCVGYGAVASGSKTFTAEVYVYAGTITFYDTGRTLIVMEFGDQSA